MRLLLVPKFLICFVSVDEFSLGNIKESFQINGFCALEIEEKIINIGKKDKYFIISFWVL